MKTTDIILLGLLVVLAFAAAILRLRLASKQGHPLAFVWKIQGFVFPVLLLVVLILYQTKTVDIVFPAVMLGLVEEIVCIWLRRKRQRD